MHVYGVRARLVVGCVLLSLVAGCGGDPPNAPPFTPAASSTSPTPTGPVEPVLPDAAQEPTEAGAKAFAEFYWEMGTYAQATGATSGIRSLGASTCVPCAAGADAIDRLRSEGAVIRGGAYLPEALRVQELSSNLEAAYAVTVRLRISAQVIDYPGTRKDQSDSAATKRVRMVVNFLKGKWVVAHWEEA